MWFYYNGFIHFAGQSKPRVICDNQVEAVGLIGRL
jgi:hypothetical protein